jgi:hypothetical protein
MSAMPLHACISLAATSTPDTYSPPPTALIGCKLCTIKVQLLWLRLGMPSPRALQGVTGLVRAETCCARALGIWQYCQCSQPVHAYCSPF